MDLKQSHKNKPFARILIGIFLSLPVGYLFYKSNLSNAELSDFDRLLKYCFPLLVVAAFLIDSWDKHKPKGKKIIESTLLIAAAVVIGFGIGQGNNLNESPVLGTFVIGLFLVIFSSVFFYFGSYQYKEIVYKDRNLKKAYHFSICCLFFAILQIPIWSLISGKFPPNKFNKFSAVVIAVSFLFSLFGPATPWILMLRRHLVEMKDLRKNQNKKR